jgi:prepilin-type N-terminal cleavage/methylation domain-containing protein
MKTSTPFCNSARAKPGLTLIEVLAGLALMATLLVAMLYLKSRFMHQLVASNLQLRSTAEADKMMTNWWADPEAIPVNGAGIVPGSPDLSWQTTLVSNDVVHHLGGKVVRLQVISAGRVVTTVEFMLPLEVRRES